MIRVKLGEKFTLQIAHIVLLINLGVICALYGNLKSYQKPQVQESPVIKNMRLSKKWQYETYLYQSCICFACWLYVMKFVSLNDQKKKLEDKLAEVGPPKNKVGEREENKHKEPNVNRPIDTRRPKDDNQGGDKKND